MIAYQDRALLDHQIGILPRMIQELRPLIPPCWHCQQANGNCNRLADSLLFARLSQAPARSGDAAPAGQHWLRKTSTLWLAGLAGWLECSACAGGVAWRRRGVAGSEPLKPYLA